ncbi:hypothetical protein MRX96_029951 [Rhipicephalus microplus]
MATGMDSVNVPEELLQHLLGQTNGSAIQREQIAAAVRQRLMTAEPMPAGAMTAAAAAAIQPAIDCAPRASGSQPPAVRWIRRCAVTRRIPGPPRDLLLGDWCRRRQEAHAYRARCAGGEREVVAALRQIICILG